MLVLDADSVMSGAAILRQVRIMEGHPEIGILQQLIVGLPNSGPFPRIFQFGMRHGMRAYTVGSAWWQGDCGPYWGHNALIRIAPFMAHCRLPVLPGGPPLGGRVLSHDQVEAVLMRRAGWEVRALPEEAGSFEENPPTLLDFVKRDLRWCQGNWQYLHLVGRPDLHWMGRLQLVPRHPDVRLRPGLDCCSRWSASAAPWPRLSSAAPTASEPLTPIPGHRDAVGALGAAGRHDDPGVRTEARRRRPGAAGAAIASRLWRRLCAWRVSTLVELAVLLHPRPDHGGRAEHFRAGACWPAGRSAGRRSCATRAHLAGREAMRGLWPQTLLGLVLGATVWGLAPEPARLWAVLFCGPLLLAVPFAVVTLMDLARPRCLARLGICAVPEEVCPPRVVVASGHAVGWPARPVGGGRGPGAAEVPAAPPGRLTGHSAGLAEADIGCGRVKVALEPRSSRAAGRMPAPDRCRSGT